MAPLQGRRPEVPAELAARQGMAVRVDAGFPPVLALAEEVESAKSVALLFQGPSGPPATGRGRQGDPGAAATEVRPVGGPGQRPKPSLPGRFEKSFPAQRPMGLGAQEGETGKAVAEHA